MYTSAAKFSGGRGAFVHVIRSHVAIAAVARPAHCANSTTRHFSSKPSLEEDKEPNMDACWALLDLQPGAAPADIRARYLELAKKWHPDVVHADEQHEVDALSSGSAASGDNFRRLRSCYELLTKAGQARAVPDWLRELRENYRHSKDPFP